MGVHFDCLNNGLWQITSTWIIVRRHLFHLLDYVTLNGFFSDWRSQNKKNDMVKYIVTYHNFLNLGSICKLPFLINYQILMFKYYFVIIFVRNFDKLAKIKVFGAAKVCLRQRFIANLSPNLFFKSQFFRSAGNAIQQITSNVIQQIKKVSPNDWKKT